MKSTLIAESFLDKAKYKKLYIFLFVFLILSLSCVLWAHFNWEDHSATYKNALTGKVREKGWAPTLYGWGLGLAGCIVFILIILWRVLDFKNPSLGVYEDGLLINKEFFKNNFIKWEEFSSIEMKNNDHGSYIELKFSDPSEVVQRQSGISKAFLKQSYIKDGEAFRVSKEDEPAIYEALLKYQK